MSQKFIKKKEDFVCAHCGQTVTGNGYTNHCPNCLYSQHVDINPGDRAATCGGLMKPVSLTLKNGQFEILHQCLKCGHTKVNKTAPDDNLQAML